ncbi:hypothetical protein GS575_09455 [Rhodococcus hoagii]|nr:hypothetical protein [Prescottella equi]
MKLFVDDERPAPDGWFLARTEIDARNVLVPNWILGRRIESLSLDYDLGLDDETTMPILHWMRERNSWPRELYVHTANEDAEEAMLAFIRANAPAGILRGWGCNFWGTGPDSRIQNWEVDAHETAQ